MNWYLKRKHAQFRAFREKHFNRVLLSMLLVLMIILDCQLIGAIFTPRVIYIEGASANALLVEQSTNNPSVGAAESIIQKDIRVEESQPASTPQIGLIEKIKATFPEAPELAVQVAWAESRIYNYTHLNNAKAKGTYKGECSVGVFQINLAENGCEGKWVHASKIPGETIQDKIEWLRVPENNLKIARQVYESRGNTFLAWGGYTNGSYKNYKQ